MTKNFIYTASALLIGSAFALTSCQSEEDFGKTPYGDVLLTVTANRAEAGSRTSFEHDGNGGLLTNWDDNDQLVVTDKAGNNLGVLTIKNGAGTSSATFEGTVKLADLEYVNIHYLGNALTSGLEELNDEVLIDASAQNGSFASLTDYDYLYQEAAVSMLNDGTATATIDMDRAFATGYFTLECSDFSLEAGDVVTISAAEGTTLYSKPVVKFRNFGWSRLEAAEGTVTITKAEAGNDFYVLFPANQDITPVFTVTKGTTVYTASLGKHTWNAQTHVNADGTSNTPVRVTDWTKTEKPIDLGDLGNWGLPTSEPTYINNGQTSPNKTSDEVGWVYNQYLSIVRDCYFNPITFTANGGVDGYLYSTNRAEPSYYQWGRWLGFPLEIGISPILNYKGGITNDYRVSDNSYPIFLNPDASPSTSHFGYTNSNVQSLYCRIQNNIWSNWDVQKSQYAASVWGMDPTALSANKALDYIVNGYNTSATWTDRGSNPCPDGYRLPTKAELQFLVPSQTGFSTYAEIKTSSSGQKYAIRWKVGTRTVESIVSKVLSYVNSYNNVSSNVSGTTIPQVTITTFKVDNSETTVNSNDSRFEGAGANSITIGAYGTLAANGAANYYGQRAYIWCGESQLYGGSVSGYSGAALQIRFSDGKITAMGVTSLERAQGANIIPVKDKDAKGGSLTPYWPYCMIGIE